MTRFEESIASYDERAVRLLDEIIDHSMVDMRR